MATLVDYLTRSASAAPERRAVRDPDGTWLTYGELREQARRVAGFLVTRGVRPGDRVGVVLPKGTAALTAMWGILEAGAAYVPVDHQAPVERNRAILSDCGVRAVFITPEALAAVEEPASGWTPVAVVVTGEVVQETDASPVSLDMVLRHPSLIDDPAIEPTSLAYILYTSGSTGVPKGVMLTHENATAFVDWCSSVFAPTTEDRFSSHAPFHFDLSVLDIFLCAKHGAELYVVSEELGKNPRDLAEFIREHHLTVWYSTPSILSLLGQFGGIDRGGYESLRLVLFAGEVFPVKHLRHVTGLWPWAEYYNLYGPTETNVCTFARIPLPVPADRTEPYPIGEACAHCEALVLDEGGEVSSGQEGLLYISGPSVFQGYWNRPAENARAFMERDGRRWYNTGDVVCAIEGHGFLYRGRRDRMVKRRGYRIELGEVERAMYQHPAVREAAVVAVPDDASGVRIVAHLSFTEDARPTIIELKTHSARHLPASMVPDVFRVHDVLPRTATDKVDYQRLRESGKEDRG